MELHQKTVVYTQAVTSHIQKSAVQYLVHVNIPTIETKVWKFGLYASFSDLHILNVLWGKMSGFQASSGGGYSISDSGGYSVTGGVGGKKDPEFGCRICPGKRFNSSTAFMSHLTSTHRAIEVI